MKHHKSLRFLAAAMMAAAFGAGSLSYAQETAETGFSHLSFAPAPSAGSQPQPADKTASQDPAASTDGNFHVDLTPYLWFPWTFGTIGARGVAAGIYATPGDLLSHFRFGLMALTDVRYKRLVAPIDMMWVRLGDDKALPFPALMETTANVTASEFILTPKIGYRVVDQKMLKIDALTGFRYWHFGQNLSFTPSRAGLNFSGSQNWVDPLIGTRITAALSPKTELTAAGDIGGWGVGAHLDYQVVGALGYKVKPKLTLQVGYRYLYIDYLTGGAALDLVTSGPMFGLTINLK